jgi:hypothetical protein
VSAFACLDVVNSCWRDHRDGIRLHDRLPSTEWQMWFLERWGFVLDGKL